MTARTQTQPLAVAGAALADALRFLAADAVERAKSGHPGAPLGMAEIAEALWRRHLRHNPTNPAWADRDRFVLSNGHASMLLYALLDDAAEHGYGAPAFDVNNKEQIHAIMRAAVATDGPVILQASAGARKYAGEPFLRKLVEAALETNPQIPNCPQPFEFDPRAFLKAATAAAEHLCAKRFDAFGCAGRASRIRPLPLDVMAQRHAGTPARRAA